MNPKEAIMKLKALFEDMPTEAPVQLEMLEYALADGSKIKCSALEVGGDVQLIDGLQAPAGEYKLADGTSMQVDDMGKIVEISSATEDTIPEEVPAQMSVEVENKINEVSSTFEDKIKSLKEENEVLKGELNSINEKMKSGFNQVLNLFDEMSKIPTSEPIENQKSFKFNTTNDIKFERLNKYRNAILNNKN